MMIKHENGLNGNGSNKDDEGCVHDDNVGDNDDDDDNDIGAFRLSRGGIRSNPG